MTYGGGYGGPTLPGVRAPNSGRYSYGPSRYLFKNEVDIYIRVTLKDKDKATVPTYLLAGSGFKCSVQPGRIQARYDENEKIEQFIPYSIFFYVNPGLIEYAHVNWIDDVGITHKILVKGTRSEGGIGATFCIDGEERV